MMSVCAWLGCDLRHRRSTASNSTSANSLAETRHTVPVVTHGTRIQVWTVYFHCQDVEVSYRGDNRLTADIDAEPKNSVYSTITLSPIARVWNFSSQPQIFKFVSRLTNLRVNVTINKPLEKLRSTRLTNHKAQRLFLADAFTPRQHVFDLGALFHVLPARILPGYQRACLAQEIPLGKDMVREVRQALTLEVR